MRENWRWRGSSHGSPQACVVALVPMSPTCTTNASSCALMRAIRPSSFVASACE